MRILLIPKDEVEMVNNWQVNGCAERQAGVSRRMGCSFPSTAPTTPPPRRARTARVYRIPTSLLFASGFGTVAMGAARAALDAAKELADRKVPGNMDPATPLLRDWSTTQRQVGEAEGDMAFGARVPARSSRRGVEDGRGGQAADDEPAHTHAAGEHACQPQGCRCGGHRLYPVRVVSDIREQPVQRRFQDVHVINQQVQGRLSHYDTAGRFLWEWTPARWAFLAGTHIDEQGYS